MRVPRMSILPPEGSGDGEDGIKGAEETARDLFEDIVESAFVTGLTMARYAGQAVGVTLVTCTRGERGEVIGAEDPNHPRHAELASLARRPQQLGQHRARELSVAMEALGVTDHRFLGDDALAPDGTPAPVRYEDSGMSWVRPGVAGPSADAHPNALALADVNTAALHLVRILRETRPQVVVTYEPGGGYGHPDHIATHRITMRAVQLAADAGTAGHGEPWQVSRVFWVVTPRSVHERTGVLLAECGLGEQQISRTLAQDTPAMVVPDDRINVEIHAPQLMANKVAALRAHATQVIVGEGVYALSNRIWRPLYPSEFFMIAPGTSHGGPAPTGIADGFFAGLG